MEIKPRLCDRLKKYIYIYFNLCLNVIIFMDFKIMNFHLRLKMWIYDKGKTKIL